MELTRRPKRRPDVLVQNAGGTVVLLDPESGEYYSLDEVGAEIWELADGSHDVDQLVAAIEAQYDADPATIRRDVLELLGELERARLVEVSDAT